MASGSAEYKAVAEKQDLSDADLEAEEKRVAALEAELMAADARIEAAQQRHKVASKQIAEELAKPLTEPASKPKKVANEKDVAEIEAAAPSDGINVETAAKSGSKNTSAKTDKENSRDRWLANKATEERIKKQAKKARGKLRSYQRGARAEFNQDVDGAGGGAPAAAAAPEAAAAPKEAAAAPVHAFTPKERSPLFESDEVKDGAKSLAERLGSLKGRTNAAEKRAAALKVLCGGRENYYTSEPYDVLADLGKRGLVEADLCKELDALVRQTDASKGGPIPPEEWLAHAQKVKEVERKDDAPYKEAELQYLKWVDRVELITAEAELDAAEQKLEELLKQVETCMVIENDDEPPAAAPRKVSAEQAIDEDYAAQLEDQYDQDGRPSKGMKNASALSDKVVSKEKWLAERGSENRDFEKNIKAREARRDEARDVKKAGGDVGE